MQVPGAAAPAMVVAAKLHESVRALSLLIWCNRMCCAFCRRKLPAKHSFLWSFLSYLWDIITLLIYGKPRALTPKQIGYIEAKWETLEKEENATPHCTPLAKRMAEPQISPHLTSPPLRTTKRQFESVTYLTLQRRTRGSEPSSAGRWSRVRVSKYSCRHLGARG